jgi:hypothetical protein
MPVTTPVPAPIVAVAVDEELQVPPVVGELRVITDVTQVVATPEIAAGKGLTVSTATLTHAPNAYDIIEVPGATPVTMPDVLPIDAAAPVLLLQVPPVSVIASAVVAPGQAVSVPLIEESGAFTVRVLVAIHPVPSVYVIFAVPVVMPVTTPDVAPTVATEVLLLVHDIPPEVASV